MDVVADILSIAKGDATAVTMSLFMGLVKVYSVKSNSWPRVKDFPYCIWYIWYLRVNGVVNDDKVARMCEIESVAKGKRFPLLHLVHLVPGVFISGALHWVANERPASSYMIAVFDLGSEEYELVPTPEFSDKNFTMNLDDLGGSLCMYCGYFDYHVDIWVMKEYGIKESWTKLFSFVQGSVIKSFHYVKPIAYSKNGRELILGQDNAMLLRYDLKKEKVTTIKIHGLRYIRNTHMCLGSVVPLHGVGESDEKQQAQKKMHKKKR
ncbi:F-box protein CPR1-like [Cornus florida]|uniref:F-box protein CPR1-like n=1 Tax=Cornus florida TaxID=4283 RepID=UPI0028A1020B|nr:F-box protein CPR1-like [Cornus florida]